jgi:hypothetical protein
MRLLENKRKKEWGGGVGSEYVYGLWDDKWASELAVRLSLVLVRWCWLCVGGFESGYGLLCHVRPRVGRCECVVVERVSVWWLQCLPFVFPGWL